VVVIPSTGGIVQVGGGGTSVPEEAGIGEAGKVTVEPDAVAVGALPSGE